MAVSNRKDLTSTGRRAPEPAFQSSWFWRVLPAGMRRRWWMFRLFDLMIGHWPVFRKQRGLLVVRMDGIGDMVLFRRSLDDYSAAFGIPASEITVLGCASWQPIADELFQGYGFHAIDEHAFARQPFYRFKVGLWVRQLAPAIVVCDSYFRRALMADSLVWMSGASEKIVSLPFVNEATRTEFTYYLSQVERVIDTGPYPTHEVIRHYRFLSAVSGKDVTPSPPKIVWPDQDAQLPAGPPYVVLNPGSNEPGRRWPFDNYLEIAQRFLDAGYRIVIVGGRDERPGDYRSRFGDRDDIFDLIGQTDLPRLLDIMKHAACVVSNDTGPAHLSIALETPTVVVVGGGHFGSFVPYPVEVAPPNVRFVFRKMECYHCFWRCHKRRSKVDVFPCISGVGHDEVWDAVTELMPSVAGAASQAMSV